MSDSKSLDAQAGSESFSGALLAAIAGVNSVSGPSKLDFLLTFSLPKLVFDNEICGQALHVIGEREVLDDLPKELYLTDAVIDRKNREAWEESGSPDLVSRASAIVDERLACYTPIETDAAMRQLVIDGFESQQDKIRTLTTDAYIVFQFALYRSEPAVVHTDQPVYAQISNLDPDFGNVLMQVNVTINSAPRMCSQ